MLVNDKRVAILLATYNGSDYLKEQIDSIINQTYKNWTLYIRDDGSNDETLAFVDNLCKSNNRIMLINDSEKHVGAAKSFMRLLENIDSELYMFCDQDDVWKDDKIKISLDAYDEVNADKSRTPIVVHTDVSVTDENLNIIVKSQWKDSNIYPDKLKSYNMLAICCYTQGNTMLFNNKAKELCFPLKDTILMHDWWVSTRVMKAGGVIKSVYEPTLLYRQHADNVLGVRTGKANSILSRFLSLNEAINENRSLYKSIRNDGFGSLIKYLLCKAALLYHMHATNNYK